MTVYTLEWMTTHTKRIVTKNFIDEKKFNERLQIMSENPFVEPGTLRSSTNARQFNFAVSGY
jgi:hypothetical protein